ncbi:uncharacterized protein M6B38_109055 [Iris pallida]|uniref:NADH dehydrogenase subunit 5 n=1 Tax=Iris pallida TaxID=29817 RepID=A0AAX6EGL6_IRIPA|nr:uncharacterized protein M6B38_109055 [Iris pallida]
MQIILIWSWFMFLLLPADVAATRSSMIAYDTSPMFSTVLLCLKTITTMLCLLAAFISILSRPILNLILQSSRGYMLLLSFWFSFNIVMVSCFSSAHPCKRLIF